jgi:predicted alpha/beta-fold hydrolase
LTQRELPRRHRTDCRGQAGDYRSPRWLPGAHLQTIWSALIAPKPRVPLKRERFTAPDGDFIDIDFGPAPASLHSPIWVLFHGLEGSSQSHYARAITAHATSLGWQGAVVHFRGCSGELNLAPRAYHSGDSDEIDWILRALHSQHPGRPLVVSGVSLGGNALLKWLGERGEDAAFVAAAAAICPPQDLQAGAESLSRGFNLSYSEYFLRSLRPKTMAMLARWPGLVDAERVRRARTFFDFDDAVTAPLHGFTSCYDYWTRSSCRQYLAGIRRPTLIINARNDPFVPVRALAPLQEVSSSVELVYTEQGGHVGFPAPSMPGRFGWVPLRIAEFFADQCSIAPRLLAHD